MGGVIVKKIIAVLLTAALAGLPALGQEDGQLTVGIDGQIPVGTFTCADHIKMVELEDGRSDVRIVWAHGYYSALKGIDENSPPIDVGELVDFSQRLDKACRAEPDKLFIVAIKELK